MVSLKQRQDLAGLAEADPHLKRIQLLLNGETPSGADLKGGGVREELLSAIVSNDAARFKECAAKIAERKVSPESDWCGDDYLLFLLLLGNLKFGHPLPFLSSVIEVRRQNRNPVPQKINEVFAALERGEFGIDGEFGFLKIPFLHLSAKLKLGPKEARKALEAMSAPGLQDQMPPLLQLLTQKAYDLVLTERQPLAAETTGQLIEAFETHAKNLSLRQWRRIVAALPGRLILALITAVISLGLIPVLIGVGKGLVDSYRSKEIRTIPSAMAIAAIREPASSLPPEALSLAKSLSPPASPPGKRSVLIAVEGAPFPNASSAFAVEVSHPDRPIRNAFALTQDKSDRRGTFTVVPVERDSGRFRAILSEQPVGRILWFVLEFEADANEDFQSIGRRVAMRPLR